MPKFQIFIKNLYPVLEKMWKKDLVWLSRPLNMVLAIWANFGPLRAKISKIGWGTPTFYWSPRLYLPIGIQNWPYFGWGISLHFCLRLKSQVRPVFRRLIFWLWLLMDMTAFPGPIFKTKTIFGNNFPSYFQIWGWKFKFLTLRVCKSWKTLPYRRLLICVQ